MESTVDECLGKTQIIIIIIIIIIIMIIIIKCPWPFGKTFHIDSIPLPFLPWPSTSFWSLRAPTTSTRDCRCPSQLVGVKTLRRQPQGGGAFVGLERGCCSSCSKKTPNRVFCPEGSECFAFENLVSKSRFFFGDIWIFDGSWCVMCMVVCSVSQLTSHK